MARTMETVQAVTQVSKKPPMVSTVAIPSSLNKAIIVQRRPRIVNQRLSSLLEAAADVFLEQGYDKANLGEISKRAGASKASLYARYPTKEVLFAAVLEQRLNRVFSQVNMENIPADAPLNESLQRFGEGLLDHVLSDGMVGLTRTISTVAHRFPHLGRSFLELGSNAGVKTLSRYLEAKVRLGQIISDEPAEIMARQFIVVAIDGLLYRKLLGQPGDQSEAVKREQVNRAIRMFVRCYATDSR